jgi:hypothetical protein
MSDAALVNEAILWLVVSMTVLLVLFLCAVIWTAPEPPGPHCRPSSGQRSRPCRPSGSYGPPRSRSHRGPVQCRQLRGHAGQCHDTYGKRAPPAEGAGRRGSGARRTGHRPPADGVRQAAVGTSAQAARHPLIVHTLASNWRQLSPPRCKGRRRAAARYQEDSDGDS